MESRAARLFAGGAAAAAQHGLAGAGRACPVVPPVAAQAYAFTVHVGDPEQLVVAGEVAVRLPLPGRWTATACGTELHRVTGAPAAVTATERETA